MHCAEAALKLLSVYGDGDGTALGVLKHKAAPLPLELEIAVVHSHDPNPASSASSSAVTELGLISIVYLQMIDSYTASWSRKDHLQDGLQMSHAR